MSDDLLPYYNRELSYLRRLGAEFAEAHPKIASRLRLARDTTEDPHVSRLIEAFAYLSARIRHKLDDDFPEITDAILGVLYPHYQAPIPSAALVQFALDRSEGELTTGYEIPKGSMVETESIDGEPCRFRTCYPVTLWPIEVVRAEMAGRPFVAPATRFSAQSAAVVHIHLRTLSPTLTFDQLDLRSLRFYLNGQDQHVLPLYELIFNNVTHVALAARAKDPQPVVLEPACLAPVGFERDQGLLPYSPRSFLGYRLLTEYFVFPQKYLFFDLTAIEPARLKDCGNNLEIFLYLDRTMADLERNVSADTLRLGCAPLINLFPKRAEPIKLTQTQYEYHIVPDARRRMATEVYSIDHVEATSPDDRKVEFLPFYSLRHGADQREQKTFWYATRKPGGRFKGQADTGTDVYLSLVDLDLDPSAPADWIIDVETTCLNRDLPGRLFKPRLTLSDGGPIAKIECLAGPTPTRRPPLKKGALWRVLSHLLLNHLSIADLVPHGRPEAEAPDGTNPTSADALREILRLYDFSDSEKIRTEIESIFSVRSRRVVGRTGGDVSGGFCRGVEVTIQFDESKFPDHGVYLFASVIERFLGLYGSINSFSKLVALSRQRDGALRRWPPRAGEKALL
jgi:type VI secretion system protein ImpG